VILSLIAAAAENNVIGDDSGLLWHIPEDLAHFRKTTMGHHVLMGRKSFETLARPLEGRTLIVLTRQRNLSIRHTWNARSNADIFVVHSPEDAVALAGSRGESELFIAGGGEIYRVFWRQAQRIYLTRVHASFEGDTFFPVLGPEWIEESREDRKRKGNLCPISFILFRRNRVAQKP
jgi:dihydrofolate reductase